MPSAEWYRNTEWNDRIAEGFFARLARARTQRDQYLVIQALTLARSHPHATLDLVDRYFATRRNDFHDARAHVAKAEAYKTLDQLPDAIRSYKDALAREAEFSGLRTSARLDLPYLVATRGVASEYDFALGVLQDAPDHVTFPVEAFLWHAAQAFIAADRGRSGEAADHARRAVDAAGIKSSGFRYHQNVGLVGEEHQGALGRLARLAG